MINKCFKKNFLIILFLIFLLLGICLEEVDALSCSGQFKRCKLWNCQSSTCSSNCVYGDTRALSGCNNDCFLRTPPNTYRFQEYLGMKTYYWDCPDSYWDSDYYCSGSAAYRKYVTSTCVIPTTYNGDYPGECGTSTSYERYASWDYKCCSSHSYTACYDNDVYWYNSCSVMEEKKEECGINSCDSWGANYCKNGSVYHSRTCYARGCNANACYTTPSTEEALVETCSYGCLEGACVQCELLSVEVTSLCTGALIDGGPQRECLQSDQVLVEADYTLACGTPRYLQVDLESEDCSIKRTDGDIIGISLSCLNGKCEGFWETPFVPEDCRGEQMLISTTGLYTDSNYTDWLTGPATTELGTITLSDSYIPSLCNNGIIDAGETCDFVAGNPIFGEKLDGTCSQFNSGIFTAGNLNCLPNCQIDTDLCTGPAGTCGDSIINPGETCDSSVYPILEGETESYCSDYDSFKSGVLTCSNCILSTLSCSVVEEETHGCGNNLWEAPEECDGTDEAGLANCAVLIPDAQEVSCISPGEEDECTCIGYGAGTIMQREAGSCSYDEDSGRFYREVKFTEIDGVTGETLGETTEQEECSLEPKKVPFFTVTNILFVVILLVMFYIFRIYMNKSRSQVNKTYKKGRKRKY